MARPKKTNIEYFPHTTSHGKTMFIIENRWGNDGYAAWFKLLERIGITDGLFIDCRDVATWEHLSAYCRVTPDMLNEMIDVFATINAVDRGLWSHKLIYCQKLVDGVKDAFCRRKEKLPTRQTVIEYINATGTGFMSAETPLNGVNVSISTERERERERERIPTTTEIVLADRSNSETSMRNCFEVYYSKLEALYPHANLPAEMETCIAHYAKHLVLDPYPVILKWLNRVSKGRPVAPSRESERDRILQKNAASCREFAGGA